MPLAALALLLVAQDITAGPPPKDLPKVPGWGFWPAYPKAWEQTFQGQLERTKRADKEPIDLVFLGDSITQGWTDENGGKAVWDARFAPLRAVDYGIGGDTTRQILWRLDHGLVDGLAPKAVVLMIGTNNLYGDFNAGTDEEIADGVAAVLSRLRQKLPKANVLLLGVLPRQNDYFCGRIAHLNALLAKLADGKRVTFLDLGPAYLDAPGKPKPALFTPDLLHLSPAGYAAWADGVAPSLRKIMRTP